MAVEEDVAGRLAERDLGVGEKAGRLGIPAELRGRRYGGLHGRNAETAVAFDEERALDDDDPDLGAVAIAPTRARRRKESGCPTPTYFSSS